MNIAEKELRRRIRGAIDNTNLSEDRFREIEDEILALIREYVSAPEHEKEEVYQRGEERLLHALELTAGRSSLTTAAN